MSIDKIGSGPFPVAPSSDSKKAKEAKAKAAEQKDRVELSEEAKQRFAADELAKLNAIQAKIQDGFYNSKEVVQKVVEGLMRDLKNKSSEK